MSLRSVHYSVARLLRRRRSMSFTSSRSNSVMTGPFRSSKATPKEKVSWSRSHPTWRHAAGAHRSFGIRQTDDSRTHFQAARIAVHGSRSSLLPRLTATGRQWRSFPPALTVWRNMPARLTEGFMPRILPVPAVVPGSGSKMPGAHPERSTGQETMRQCWLGRASGSGVARLSRSRGLAASICCATRRRTTSSTYCASARGEKANRWRCYLPIVASLSGICFSTMSNGRPYPVQ